MIFLVEDINPDTVLFISSNGQSYKEYTDTAMFAWADTGKTANGHKVFISMRKVSSMQFEGSYVGTFDILADSLTGASQKVLNILRSKVEVCKSESIDNKVNMRIESSLVSDIKNILLIDNWRSEDGLSRYIYVVGSHIGAPGALVGNVIVNRLSDVLVNTGLLNKYGSFIYMVYRYNKTKECYIADRIIDSKHDLVEAGFSAQTKLDDLSPYELVSKEEHHEVLTECIDVTDKALHHGIDEHKERLVGLFDLSKDSTYTDIRTALDRAVTLWTADANYAKPSYGAKSHAVNWYLPLHVYTSMNDKPDLIAAFIWEEDKVVSSNLYSFKSGRR